MTNIEQTFKIIEGRIETMQKLAVECIELIYLTGYNNGLEEAAKMLDEQYPMYAEDIRKLKK